MNFNHHMANAVVPQATSAFSIPIKICDGLFMADHYIAQDAEFFQTNLITHVINCAGQQVPNSQKVSGVAFLTFDWSQKNIQSITEQKVISVTVSFIQQCRKQAGCLLINYYNSQSRPFCLLACYFMVRYKWSLFKTLQFLNSRKQDVELEPAFFQQLTAFAQKLQDKGLIRSKTWVISQGMTDQQIIITNTYLNSKNKFGPLPPSNNYNKNKNKGTVTWKKDMIIEHNYCPNSVIQQRSQKVQKIQKQNRLNLQKHQKGQRKSLMQQPRNNQKQMNNSRQKREQSIKKLQKQPPMASQSHHTHPQNQNQSSNSQLHSQTQTHPHPHSQLHSQTQPHSQIYSQYKNSLLQQKQKQKQKQKSNMSASLTEMNVTKKWAELRQMWLREKENHNPSTNLNLNMNINNNGNNSNSNDAKCNQYPYPEVPLKQTPLIPKKDKINDRLQQKLQLLKKHEQKLQLQPSKNKKQAIQSDTQRQSKPIQRERERDRMEKQKIQNSRLLQDKDSNSRIMHNNWIIDNQVVGPVKSKVSNSNKSVIIVKPNHGGSLDNKNTDKDKQNKQKQRQKDKQNKLKDSSLFNSNIGQSGSNNASRSSLRKIAGSERKQQNQNNSSLNKQNSGGTAKFFRNEAAEIITTKGRCNSAKPQRKQNVSAVTLGLGLSKNGSLKGKGKWKF